MPWSMGKAGINCFVLITGYYLCTSRVSLKKFLQLLGEVVFYNIAIYVFLVVFKQHSFSIDSFAETLFITGNNSYQFPASFLMFFFLIPFINILLNNISFIMHSCLICLMLFIYSFRATFPFFFVQFNYVTWFVIIYVVGAYFCLWRDKLPNFLFDWKSMAVISIVMAIIGILSVLFGIEMSKITNDEYAWYFLVDSNKILSVLTAVSFFLFFKAIPIPHCRIINILGGSTFGVLLIHNNCMEMTVFIWEKIHPEKYLFTGKYVLYSIAIILTVYLACSLIDIVFKNLIEKPIFNTFGKTIDSWEEKIINKYKNPIN